MRRVTIKDISRETGLSRGTISRALNDRPDISLETKKRVMEACRKLNYMPSHAARSLATGRNYALAALVADMSDEFVARILSLATAQAMRTGYILHVLQTDAESAPRHLAALAIDRVDGVLNLLPLDQDRMRELLEVVDRVPIVSLAPVETPCDAFLPDHLEAGRMAARCLTRAGRRNVIALHRPQDSAWIKGFEEALGAEGHTPKTVTCAGAADLQRATELIESADGVAASDDYVAAGAMCICLRSGRRPGSDVDIIGCGNTHLAEMLQPPLTSVDLAVPDLVRRGMDLLLRRIGGGATAEKTCIAVAPRIVQRATTSGRDT